MVVFVLVAWSAAAGAAILDYYIWDDFGGTWHDANKSTQRSDISMYCWTGAGADALDYTGWVPNSNLDDAQEIFNYVADHWDDGSGYTYYMWDWWFSGFDPGEGWAHPDSPNIYGDFFETPYTFDDFYHHPIIGNQMQGIEQELKAGRAVTTLTIASQYGTGHFHSVWGFKYNDAYGTDDPRRYVGMYICESDMRKTEQNPPETLDYYELTYTDGAYHFTLNQKDWTINSIYSLDRQVSEWTGGTGAWGTAGNWTHGYLPDTKLSAEIHTGTVQLTDTRTVGEVYVGFNGTATVTHTAGTLTVTDMKLGMIKTSADGRYDIGNSAALTVDKFVVGDVGTGRFNITGTPTINVNNYLQFGANANYSAVSGTNLNFNYVSSFKNAAKTAANVAGLAETTFLFNGNGTSSVRMFEVAGQDLGAVASGFTGNFHIKALTIGVGQSAYLRLVNEYLNYNGTPPESYSEALYVHTLTLNSGSTLDLNGFHMYVGAFNNYGTVLNGSVTVVQGGLGNGPEAIPEPAALAMILPALLGLGAMVRRRR
jgi:hypothetical protein